DDEGMVSNQQNSSSPNAHPPHKTALDYQKHDGSIFLASREKPASDFSIWDLFSPSPAPPSTGVSKGGLNGAASGGEETGNPVQEMANLRRPTPGSMTVLNESTSHNKRKQSIHIATADEIFAEIDAAMT
ncbi:unnamed protein product, partial [Symbiodinium microadriaticum]